MQQLTWVTSYSPKHHIEPKAPSWSWLCRPVEINTPDYFSPTDDWAIPNEDMKIDDIDIQTVGGDEMSEVLSAHLKVTATLIPTSYSVVLSDCGPISASFKLRNAEVLFMADVQDEEILEQPLFSTICIYRKHDEPSGGKEVRMARGLVLKPTGQKKGQYYRVGCFLTKKTPGLDQKILCKADAAEKAQMTQDLYEEYHEDTDKYTFAVV